MARAKRAAIYIRSTHGGTSLRQQREACHAVVRDRGWSHDEGRDLYEDVGDSSRERARLLERLDEYEAVVFHSVETLADNARALATAHKAAEANGTRLVGVADDLDTGLKRGRELMAFATRMADMNTETTARRVSEAQRELAQAGRWRGGTPPFGWTIPEDDADYALLLDPEESPLMREAVERTLDGDTVRSIVRDWNDRGLKTRTGSLWRDTTLRRSLRRPYLMGHLPQGDDVVRAPDGKPLEAVEPLVDEVTYRRLQKKLEDRAGSTSRPDPGEGPLLTGMAYCDECGSNMYGRSSDSPTSTYYCSRRSSMGAEACPGVAASVGHLEEFVEEVVLSYLTPAVLEDLRERARGRDARVAAVEARIDSLRSSLETLEHDRYERGLFDGTEGLRRYKAQHGRLAQELEEAQAKRRALYEEAEVLPELVGAGASDLRSEWRRFDTDTKRAIIASVIDRVVVKKGERGKRWSADRVDIEWKAR